MKKLIRATTNSNDHDKLVSAIVRLSENVGYGDMLTYLLKWYPADNDLEAIADIADEFGVDISDIEEDY